MTSRTKATTVTTITDITEKQRIESAQWRFRQQTISESIIRSGVIGLVVFSPLALGSVHPWAYTLIEVVVLSLYLCWVIQFLSGSFQEYEPRWRLKVVKTPLSLFLSVVIGIVLLQICPLPSWYIAWISPSTHKLYLSTLMSGTAATQTLSISPWTSTRELYKLLTYIGIFYLVIYHFRNRVWIHRLVKAIVITGFFVALVGLLQHYGTPDKIYGFRDASYSQPFGPYINRNHFAGYMGMTICVTVGVLLSFVLMPHPPPDKWRSFLAWWEVRIPQVVLLGFSVVVMLVSLALSLSRGGMISLLCATLFLAYMIVTRKRRLSLTLLVVLFSLFLSYLLWLGMGPVIERMSTLRYWDTLIGNRPQLWQSTVAITRDFLPLGTGLGTFRYIYPLYTTTDTPLKYDHAHNDYLEIFSDLGLIGGVILCGGLLWFLLWLLKKWSQRRHPYVVGICLGSLTGALSLLFHSSVTFNLHIPANALLFFVLLAVGFNTVFLKGEGRRGMEVISPTRDISLSRTWGRLLLCLSLCGLLILAGSAIRNYLAEKALEEVRQKVTLSIHDTQSRWVDADILSRVQRAKKYAPGYALPHYFLAKAYEQMALDQSGREAADFLDLASKEYRHAIDLEP
ncbi:MAG: O-antigen ligase family protein, partial [Thermodesulfobacteriota bacterium]